MARIPADEIERLKSEVSLQRLVEARGIELRKHGAVDLVGRCPFHDDRTPSLVVSPKNNLWHCLGACQTGGSVIDWVMRAEAVSFRHAVEMLRADAGLGGELPKGRSGRRVAKQSTTVKLAAPVAVDADDGKLCGQVVDYYHAQLKESPEALAYLESRGLSNAELIDRFKLGFANRTLGYRLPHKNRAAGAEVRGRLQALGVLRKSGHEHFNGSIVVPIVDEHGQVVEMYGRKVTANLRKGTPLHLYLPGPHRGVWNAEALAADTHVILCESLFDAMTFWAAGYRNVTCSYGVGGFTGEHVAAFQKHGIKRVSIAYDRDAAGDAAAEALAERLAEAGIGAYRVQFPKGMDANEYARTTRPAEQALALVIRRAVWMSEHRPKDVAPPAPPTPPAPHAWDEWQREALAQGLSVELSELGRQLFREACQHDWPEPLYAACTDGAALIAEALADPDRAARRWDALLQADGQWDDEDDELDHARREAATASSVSSTTRDSAATATPTPTKQELSSLAAPAAPATPAHSNAATPTRSPVPGGAAPQAPAVDMEASEHEIAFRFGDRRVRVRGLEKNKSYDALKINLLVARGEAFFVDNLDLYNARQRSSFVGQAADELGLRADVVKTDLGKVLLALEAKQEQAIAAAAAPQTPAVVLSDAERAEALSLLRDPKLCSRILSDFSRCGVVGEEINKLVGYLAATSRKLEQPLAVIVQSSSAAGKSSLMEAVLAFVPEEERVKYSAMTGQSLFYLGQTELCHKVLAIVEEEGAERASYALKLLQSEGELTIASTGKDPQSGKLVTSEYRVGGPVMIFLTTTAIEIDEELLNRCLVLTVDETAQQTAAIHERQRHSRTLEGLLGRREKDAVLRVHQNAQRLLRPLCVVNPFADRLTFAAHKTRMRRDHINYLTLIETIALLHQYQRPKKTVEHAGQTVEYIEVTAKDIAIANRLCHQVLGRTLDELPPQTRRLLGLLDELVSTACAEHEIERSAFLFSRRQMREYTGWGNTQIRVHLDRLVDMEYVAVHRGGRGQSYVYELCYDGGGQAGDPFASGLLDVNELVDNAATTETSRGKTATSRGKEREFAGGSRPQNGGMAAGLRGAGSGEIATEKGAAPRIAKSNAKNAHVDREQSAPSYTPSTVVAPAPAEA